MNLTLFFILLLLVNITPATSQTITIEGKLTNLANAPVAGATLLLNTPSGNQTTTDVNGNWKFETNDFPTFAELTANRQTTLQLGKITLQITGLTGQIMLQQQIRLNSAGKLEYPPAILAKLKANQIYIVKLTDVNMQVATQKVMVQTTP